MLLHTYRCIPLSSTQAPEKWNLATPVTSRDIQVQKLMAPGVHETDSIEKYACNDTTHVLRVTHSDDVFLAGHVIVTMTPHASCSSGLVLRCWCGHSWR